MMCLFCSRSESADCFICSSCSNRILAIMQEGKLEEVIQLAVDKGHEEKAQYLEELRKEMIEEDGREQTTRPTRRIPNRRRAVRVARGDKDKFRLSQKKQAASLYQNHQHQKTLFGH